MRDFERRSALSTVPLIMGGVDLEEASGGLAAGRGAQRGGRWLAWREGAAESSSGQMASALELRAARTDDGVLVAPAGREDSERIVWVADMALVPGHWPGRVTPPRVELVRRQDGRSETALTWTALPRGRYRLAFTVLCRPAGHLTFENDAFDGSVQVSATSWGTSIGLRPYRGLPPVEILLDRPASVTTAPGWTHGVAVREGDGTLAFEDRYSPGSIEIDLPPGDLTVRVLAGTESSTGGAQKKGAPRSYYADLDWAAACGGQEPDDLAGRLWSAPRAGAEARAALLEDLHERAGSRPVWAALEGLARWDAPSTEAPAAVEHAAQLVTLLARCAADLPKSVPNSALGRAAEAAAGWFRRSFWLSTPHRLCDRALSSSAEGRRHLGLRPHMLLAAALPEVPLRRAERRRITALSEQHLLTERGLRTLDPADHDFDPLHPARGLVWPWLVGPLAEATVLAGGLDRARLQSLTRLARAAERAPEAWWLEVDGAAGEGPVFTPVGALAFPPNALGSTRALDALAGVQGSTR